MKALAYALSVLLTLPGGGYAKHVRDRGGRAHVETLAWLVSDAASLHDVDAWILAALAFHESSFDSRRVGDIGELGITQLHPRYWGEGYRRWCWRRADYRCDFLALEIAGDALRHGLKVCGDYWHALGWFRSGRCIRGPAGLKVLRTARRMRWIARKS